MAVVSDYTALLSGTTWTGGPAGQGVILTYSFSGTPTSYLQASSPGAAATFQPLSETEKSVVHAALAQWAAVSGITFYEVKSTPGDLTFGFYDLGKLDGGTEAGLGNYPFTGLSLSSSGAPLAYSNFLTQGGDVYFDSAYRASSSFASDFAHVALHEIGHALGLKHPFDTPGNTLDPSLDNGSNTVMAYAGLRSPTLEPLDVAAVQYLYGTKTGFSMPFGETWTAATESLTEVGTAAAQDMFGSGGNDLIYSGGGNDAISGGEGDDIVYGTGVPMQVNGGPGNDLVVTGLTYSGTAGVGGSGSFRYVLVPGTGNFQTYSDVETLQFTNGVYATATNSFTPAVLGFADAATGQSGTKSFDPVSAGGPNYLQAQYIYAGTDGMAISTQIPNVFIHGGSGSDAIQVSSGQNVLDGGLGSNFLTGGTGAGVDTFFTDARTPGVVWNTIRNFHAGDAATLWGFTAGISSYRWEASPAGAAGSEGATLRANIVGGAGRTGDGIDASITFTGVSVDTAKSFAIATGSQPAGNYLYIYNAQA